MTYDPGCHFANAERRNFMEIPLSGVSGIIGEEEITNPNGLQDYGQRRYAQLTYVVNPVPVELSGDVMVDTSDLEAINSDILNAILSGVIDPALAVVVEEADDFTWVAESLAGTNRTSSLWRVKQVQTINSGSYISTIIKWADGNGSFDNVATHPLSSLTFI